MSEPNPLLALLYRAWRSPLGIIVATNDAEALRQRLYPLRKLDADLESLAFVISPDNGKDLWILRKPSATTDDLLP